MRRTWRWAGLAFLLGATSGALFVLVSRGSGHGAAEPRVSGSPKPTAVQEDVVREELTPVLPEGMKLVRVDPVWFRERADGSFGAGYFLRFESSISWFQIPVGHFEPPARADALQKKLASYLIFYPDLEPGSCYRVHRRKAVVTKGKAITVNWSIGRALFSGDRWRVEKEEPLPFERWGRVFTEEEASQVQEAEQAAWQGMVQRLQGIREGKVSSAVGQGVAEGPKTPAFPTEGALPPEQRDVGGERVERALPVESSPVLRAVTAPEPDGRVRPNGEAGAGSPGALHRLYREYERELQLAAARQRAKLAEEKKNSSTGEASKATVAP
ncbi:MAG: hypothetical protein PHP75_07885 [Methylacidiphilaceae bacterium]|nr:hypothetical protein [Candidatus Methylacidiphilaceae bacterium]